jgi:hypothetical protein
MELAIKEVVYDFVEKYRGLIPGKIIPVMQWNFKIRLLLMHTRHRFRLASAEQRVTRSGHQNRFGEPIINIFFVSCPLHALVLNF